MKKRYKIINFFLISIILLLVLSLIIYSYVIINNKINEIKLNLASKIASVLNRKIEVGTISPLFFNGVKINDFYIYDSVLNKRVAHIDTIKIRLKIIDIIFGKISVDNSIYSVYLDDFIITINDRQIKKIHAFGNPSIPEGSLRSSASTENTNNNESFKPAFDFILGNGIINIIDKKNDSHYRIKNNYSKIDFKDNQFEMDVKIFIRRAYGLLFKNSFFSLEYNGDFSEERIKGTGEIINIALNNYLYPLDLRFSAAFRDKLQNIDLKLFDSRKTLKLDLKKNNSSLDIKAVLKRFSTRDYKVNGNMNFTKKRNKLKYNMMLKSNPADKLFVNIKGDHKGVILKDLKIFFGNKKFLYASGNYRFTKEHNFNIWLNNIKYNNINFFGRALLYNGENKNNILKLTDFKINDMDIKKYIGSYQVRNNILKLKTFYSSEDFSLNLNNNFNTRNLSLKLNFNNFESSKLYKLAKLKYEDLVKFLVKKDKK